MLKVDIHEEPGQDGKIVTACSIEAEGDILQVCEDVGRVIVTTYANIKQRMPSHAGFFKFAMQRSMEDPTFWALEKEVHAGEGVSIVTASKKK